MTRVTEQYEFARQFLAGGVSSSTRVNGRWAMPCYFDRAEGCRVWDLDGQEYLDLCCSHGATLLGHGDGRVRRAVERCWPAALLARMRTSCTPNWPSCCAERFPACERVRFTGSGTEATMHCLRLARAFTGRTKILKIEGNFHGYHDQVMFAIGTPAELPGAGK